MRLIHQRLLEVLDEESPSYDRNRFVCTSPGEGSLPWLRLPRTFELDDETTYFTTDIKARRESMLTRSQWAMAFRSPQAPAPGRKVGEESEDSSSTGGKAGGGKTGGGKLLGAGLTRAEHGRSLDHRPRSPGGRFICWNNASWVGCKQADCSHSHKAIGQWRAWTAPCRCSSSGAEESKDRRR